MHPSTRPPTAPHLAAIEENERHYLAELLHDGVGQTLSLCRIKLDLLLRKLSHTPEAAELASIRGLLDQTIDETHTLVGGTSPMVLHELGLAAAVRPLAQIFRETYGLAVRVVARLDTEPDRLSANVRGTLYGAIRELLANARKYAHARQVTVTLQQDPAEFCVQVQDDGLGFDPHRPRACPSRNGGFGLRNLQRRCEQVGAQFLLRSAPGRGTMAMITMPLPRDTRRASPSGVGDWKTS